MKPRLLDLFAGGGGAAMGYHRAGFEVVGIDHVLQVNYPFAFHKLEALQTLEDLIGGAWVPIGASMGKRWCLDDFAGVHASPPCQAHSTLKARTRHIEHPDLIGPTRELLRATGLPYVIENVEGAPLHEPVKLCGSSFGLNVRRHRLFECNFPVMAMPCAHGRNAPRFEVFEHGKWRLSPTVPVYGSGGRKAVEHWAEAMGIDWMTRPELAEAIPPAYSSFLGEQLLAHITATRKAAA